MTKNILNERLDKGSVICAEGFLFEIERRGYMASGEFVPMVSLEHPEVLENLHREFQHAGSDIVEAFTYNGQDSAWRLLPQLLSREQSKGSRCVVVITGKGRDGEGVLRRNFLRWLEMPEVRHLISGFAPAHAKHGGGGAWYVYLRKR